MDEIEIPAEDFTISNLSERTERMVDVSPYLPDRVTLVEENASSVVVTILIEQPGVKNYEVSTSSITVKNLANDLEISYRAVDLEIQVKGPAEILKVFTLAKKVSIDLKEYQDAGTYLVPVVVELPDGCTLVDREEVEIILEKKTEDDQEE